MDRDRELEALVRSIGARLNALLIGDRGVGKTSLLHRLERRLDQDDELDSIFVEGARRAQNAEELLSLLAFRLDPDRTRFSHVGEMLETMGRRPPRTSTENLLAALRTIREVVAERTRRPVLILDELPAGDVGYTLFGQLRDELWTIPATWVVAAETSDHAGYLRPPASAFFETVLMLSPLPVDVAVEVLRRRTVDEPVLDSVLREIASAADGNPRRLISLARDALLEGHSVDALAAARAERRAHARELGEAAARLFAYLEENGPASASDDRLHDELGFRRSRATQLFRELESAGLVRATTERSEAGRRKLYALTEPGSAE